MVVVVVGAVGEAAAVAGVAPLEVTGASAAIFTIASRVGEAVVAGAAMVVAGEATVVAGAAVEVGVAVTAVGS